MSESQRTAIEAIKFAVSIDDPNDVRVFLNAWLEGDLREWPDFARGDACEDPEAVEQV